MEKTTAIESVPRDLHTLAQFSGKFPAWSVPSLRFHVFHAKQNGMEEQGVILRVGRRLYVSESRFFSWVAAQQHSGKRAA